MIIEAQKEFALDLGSSILVGDNRSDIQAGNKAGVGCNLLFAKKHLPDLPREHYKKISLLKEAESFLTDTS